MSYCIGLTGGIGSGKSSVARIFQELGAGIVDTDEISHALTQAGGAAIAEIRKQFGTNYIAPNETLDRGKMREHVFRDPAAKKKLERILHPLIGKEARARVAQAHEPYVLLVVPLLLEMGAYHDLIRRILVVDCTEAQQIERTMQRSALTESAVRAIMATQLPRVQRLAKADDIVHNDSSPSTLRPQVEALHTTYVGLARANTK